MCGQTRSHKVHGAAPQLVQRILVKHICSEITALGSDSQALWQGTDKSDWNWKKEKEEKGKIGRKLNLIFFNRILMGIEQRLMLHWKANQVLPWSCHLCCTLPYFCNDWILPCAFIIKCSTISEGTGIYPFIGPGGPLSACSEGEGMGGEAEKGPTGPGQLKCPLLWSQSSRAGSRAGRPQ